MNRLFSKKYLCIASVLMIMAFASSAMASVARVTSMGLERDSIWMIQKDDTYIYYNSSYLSKFTPQLWVEIEPTAATNDDLSPMGGIILNPMDNLNIMITTGKPLPYVSSTEQYLFPQNAAAVPDITLTREQFNCAASYSMGDMAFGLASAVAFANNKDDNSPKFDAHKLVILNNLGFLMDMGSGMSFDAALDLTIWDYKWTSGSTDYYKALCLDTALMGRFNYALSEANILHAFGKFSWINRTDETDPGTEVEDDYYIVTVGLSDEINVTKSSLVYVGGYVKWIREDVEGSADSSSTVFNVSLGVETNLTENLKGRFGAQRTWFNGSHNDSADTTNNTEVSEGTNPNNTEIHIGLGYKLGNVLIDWELEKAILVDGPDFISGAGAGSWATQFALTYYFETGTAAVAPAPVKKIR